jgi:hypothetical protein
VGLFNHPDLHKEEKTQPDLRLSADLAVFSLLYGESWFA